MSFHYINSKIGDYIDAIYPIESEIRDTYIRTVTIKKLVMPKRGA
jgi:hypothetical protein